MQTFHSVAEVPADFGPSAVTIGKFDGVHGGHRAVIARLRAEAAARGLVSAIVTFDRHPLALLRPEACPVALVSNDQKLELLAATGIDATLMLTFDRELSSLPAEQFVEAILVGALHVGVVLVGSDFRFGARGLGDVALLEQLGRSNGFEVVVIDDVRPKGERRVSSSWIRELLTEGRVAEAGELLGSPPTIRAAIVHGEERGRLLGYPTANLSYEVEGFVPADGVYAAWFTVDGIRYPAAVSIGNNPTFDGVPDKTVEAHLIDQKLDLYDRIAEVSFVEYIRPMQKFSGMEALSQQMGADEDRIRVILGVAPRSGAAEGRLEAT